MRRTLKQISSCACICFLLSSSFCLAASRKTERRADSILTEDPSIGLTRNELIQAFDLIETARHAKEKKPFFFPTHTDIFYTIERSFALDGFLIYNLPGNDLIGKGGQKTVRKAILYNSNPTVIARCDCDRSGYAEIQVLSQLKGEKGIVPMLGFDSINKDHHYIYLEYFPAGSLKKQIDNHHIKFSEQQLFKLALDIAKAIQIMHGKNLIHRDLHPGNILLRLEPKSAFEAVLVDFGFTRSLEDAKREVPHAVPHRNPPEMLVNSLCNIDRHLCEVHALGGVLFAAMWKKTPPWNKIFDGRKVKKLCSCKKKLLFEKIASLYNKEMSERVGSLLQKQEQNLPLSRLEQFQLLIFQMAHYNPKQRPSIDEVIKGLEYLHERGERGSQVA